MTFPSRFPLWPALLAALSALPAPAAQPPSAAAPAAAASPAAGRPAEEMVNQLMLPDADIDTMLTAWSN